MGFETVEDFREWLDTEPALEASEEALEDELDNDDRKGVVGPLEDYIEDFSDNTVTYRVEHAFGDYGVGEKVELDPEDELTQRKVRDGSLRVWT